MRNKLMNNRYSFVLSAFLAMTICLDIHTSQADSALDLLAGFDTARVAATYPPSDSEKAGELAKLLYRLRKADRASLNEKASTTNDSAAIGDAVKILGRVESIKLKRFAVPAKLIDFLEFKVFQEITIQPDDSPNQSIRVFTTSLSSTVNKDDRVSGVGVVIAIDDANATAVAAGNLHWFPKTPKSAGWRLLSEHGVDVSALRTPTRFIRCWPQPKKLLDPTLIHHARSSLWTCCKIPTSSAAIG